MITNKKEKKPSKTKRKIGDGTKKEKILSDKGKLNKAVKKTSETNLDKKPDEIRKKIITKPAPFNFSNYDRTYNNAIDLCAQAIGWARRTNKPVKAIILRPTYYDLFFVGIEVLAKNKIDPNTELFFDGTLIKRGSSRQFDNLVFDYYPTRLN